MESLRGFVEQECVALVHIWTSLGGSCGLNYVLEAAQATSLPGMIGNPIRLERRRM